MMHRIYGVLAGVRTARFTFLILAYADAMAFTLWLSYLLRFDFVIPGEYYQVFGVCVWWIIILKLLMLLASGQFRDSLSYFSTPDLSRVFAVCFISSSAIAAVNLLGGLSMAPPRGVILTDFVLSCAMLCGGRMALRLLRERFLVPQSRPHRDSRRVGIIGAGDTGSDLCLELLAKRWLGLRPLAFFDDVRPRNTRLHGIRLWGRPESLRDPGTCAKLDEIIIALPTAPAARLREIVLILQQTKLPFRIIPSMTQLAMGTVSVTNLRPVAIEDLLGRDVVQIDTQDIREMIAGRVVLVTGAGGSIGSELCRQIAAFAPRTLVMVERSEAALFPIEQELIEHGWGNMLIPFVADILDTSCMEAIFARYRPYAVFHAAAHKHVPLMESQPAEAIRNNILGTAQIAEIARTYQVDRFLLISTDKAINPTSVMGATKRMAELLVQAMQTRADTGTKFMAVRFGNVLGSSGSVVPIFTRQIAAGGPIKVTHPDVTRYFMTIPEAVSLVLQSASHGQGGDIYVLDMGDPVKIVGLARQMIELSGLTPDTDIRIEFTGLRPGEKLFEELSHSAENVKPTSHPKILRFICEPLSHEVVKPILEGMASILCTAPPHELKLLLKKVIPEYTPQMQEDRKQEGVEEIAQAEGSTAVFLPESTVPIGSV